MPLSSYRSPNLQFNKSPNRVPLWLRTWTTAAAVLICCSLVEAQEHPGLRTHHLTASIGASWLGGYPIGDRNAEIRRNAPGTAPPPFTLFRASSTFERAWGVEGRVGFALTPALALEGGGTYATPRLAVSIADDAESEAVILEGSSISQYVIDAGVAWQLSRLRLGTRARPYVTGGAGYMRQLYEDRTRVERGAVYFVGGGARYWFRGGTATSRALGVRGELKLMVRIGGVDFEDKRRIFPVLAMFGFVGL